MEHPQPPLAQPAALPNDAEQCRLQGDALQARGHLDDALRAYAQAISLRPDDLNTQNNTANLLRRMGRFAEALACYDHALRLAPEHAAVLCNRALALRDLGRIPEAIAGLRRALEMQPVFPEAWCNLGEAWRDVRNNSEALDCFRRAILQKPDFAVAHNNLGVLLRDLGQLEDAQASSRRALALRPGYLNAHSNLLLTGHYLPQGSPEDLLQVARAYGETVARAAQPFASWPNSREPQRRLRIGFVSGDLRHHPVGFFLAGVLAALKKLGGLDMIAYATRAGDADMTPRLAACCAVWHSVTAWSDARLAQQVRDDGIDILIDLAGHTAYNRLAMFAYKPAPIQASWLGYFGTTGVAAMDCLLADPWSLPVQFEAHFTEKIRRLPETRLCFSVLDEAPEVSALPALANGHITFGCFGNLSKVNDEVLALWAQVMLAIPDSRLLLKAKQLDDPAAQKELLGRLAHHGIAEGRVDLESYAARRDYLASYAKVDIVLDTFPFPGGTTSAEALWMGAPVLTMKGNSFVACQGVGIMANAGLAHWIAQDKADYLRLAQKHASNLSGLAAQRQLMRRQLAASPLFDAERFARHFETALRGMWREWCLG